MATHHNDTSKSRFKSISQDDLPQGRKGKHHAIVGQLLQEIEELKPGMALKIPLSELPDSKANVRSALNRACRQKGVAIETSSDDTHLYVWKPAVEPEQPPIGNIQPTGRPA